MLLLVLVVIAVLVALAARDGGAGGDSARERREAQEDAEARADGDGPATTTRTTTSTTTGTTRGAGGSDRTATELLATLVVRDEGSRAGYEREDFGDGWAVDGDGCDTRELVLAEESTVPVTRRGDCSVAAGRWSSLYDGDTTRDPDDLQIDHMVPLAEAWESGAASWTPERRERYANDRRRHGALVAVTAATNESKSDRDPAEWMPPAHGAWCRYAAAWIVEKHDWHLTVDPAERDALGHVLAAC